MKKLFSVMFGMTLIGLGLLDLASTFVLPLLGIDFRFWEVWRYWPVLILGVGGLLSMLAMQSLHNPRMAGVFIPALPVNTVGLILLYASLFNHWGVWSFAWSFIVLALALGFLLATIFSRNIWLGIPTIIIGMNALVLTFCSVTGLWRAWSVLWTIEPLAIGLVLLLIGMKKRAVPVTIIGTFFCGFAAIMFGMMSGALLFGSWYFRLFAPAALILVGGGLVLFTLFGSRNGPNRLVQDVAQGVRSVFDQNQ